MKKFICGLMSILTALFILNCEKNFTEAKTYRGMAAIVNGDQTKAEREAREDAMRTCIEENLGARVSSRTEVSMGMVVTDKIMINADGFVRPLSSPKFEVSDGVVICIIDLEANTQRIVQTGDDIKSQIENAINADTTGRTNIIVAVSGRDENGNLQNDANTNDITNYVRISMETQGFSAKAPDDIIEYISNMDFDNAIARADARKYARNEMRGDNVNGILRGTLSTVKVQKSGKMWTAMVKANFELVGMVSSELNSHIEYYTVADPDRDMAIDKARRRAAQKAAEDIAKSAAATIQGEMRGGVQHIKILIEISNIVDRTEQGEKVLAAIRNASCRIIRSFYDKNSPTTLKVSVDATNAGTLDEVKDNIKAQLPGHLEDGDEDTDRRGSERLYLRYRG